MEIVLSTPLMVMGVGAMAFLVGGVVVLIATSTAGFWGITLQICVSAALGSFVVVWMVSECKRTDMRGVTEWRDILSRGREISQPVFLFAGVVSVVSTIMPKDGVFGSGAEGLHIAEIVMRAGVSGMTVSMTGAMAIMVLLYPSCVCEEMTMSQARRCNVSMMMKMPDIWFGCAGSVFVGIFLGRILPPIPGVVAISLAIAWQYVAAREIFGGISENGRQGAIMPQMGS